MVNFLHAAQNLAQAVKTNTAAFTKGNVRVSPFTKRELTIPALAEGRITITPQADGDLVIFNYNPRAVYTAAWTPEERIARGLIINRKSGEIVALPFPKFFNLGERYAGNTAYPQPHTHLVRAFEKLDGSLGILYRTNGEPKIATRGSFTSPQAIWATEYLNECHNLTSLNEELTLLFEIIYPENRIVVDYGNKQSLVLLGCINRHTGEELNWHQVTSIAKTFGFDLPRTYDFLSLHDAKQYVSHLKGTEGEGLVLVYSDGTRYKLKSNHYITLHRLITRLTPGSVLDAMLNGTFAEFLGTIPDELRNWAEDIAQNINCTADTILNSLHTTFEIAPKSTRKEFALWVQNNVPPADRPLLFLLLKGEKLTLSTLAKHYELIKFT